MPTLERFQQQTSDALLDSATACPEAVSGDKRERRFDVYRNNRAVSLIENLQALYPAVARLVGQEFFTAAARAYIDAHPPTGPVMAEFGEAFGDFIAALSGAKSIPYIRDVARIEWCRNAAYNASDAPVLSLEALASVPPDTLPELRLDPHPALHTVTSRWPSGSIWAATQRPAGTDAPAVDMRTGEQIAITRPAWDADVHILTQQSAQFLHALTQGSTIGDAAASQLDLDPAFDAGPHLVHVLSLGAFTAIAQTLTADPTATPQVSP